MKKLKWPTVALGELCDIGGGNSAPQGDQHFEGGTIPFVRMRDLGRYHFTNNLTETDDKLNEETVKSLRLKLFEPGCILFPRSGSVFLNHRAILGMRACIVSHIGVLQNFQPNINRFFLYYCLQIFDMSRLAKKTTGVDSISFTDVARIPIPLPPLAEQERLVRLLDEADTLRRLRARADERMSDFIPALFHEMFGDPVRNEKGWPVVETEQLFSRNRPGVKCGPFGSALKKYEYADSGVPVWGIDNVTPNQFIESDSLFITKAKYAELGGYSVEAGDILISRAGTVGRMCVAHPLQSPSIIGTNLIRLVFNQDKIIPEYFTSLFTHFPSTASLRANADEGAYSFMNTKVLKSLQIPVPPLPLQREFAARAASFYRLRTLQAQSAARLGALFESMLAKAFAGEL